MGNLDIITVGNNVEAQYVEMMVPLYSYGCEKKIKKALSNLKGIYSVKVDFYQQKVTVWGICDKENVLTIVKSKRRGAHFWNSDDDTGNDYKSHFEPLQSPLTRASSTRFLSMIKHQSLKLDLSMMRRKSFNWQSLRKVFVRSNSF